MGFLNSFFYSTWHWLDSLMLCSAGSWAVLEGPRSLHFHVWVLGAGCLLKCLLSPPGGLFSTRIFISQNLFLQNRVDFLTEWWSHSKGECSKQRSPKNCSRLANVPLAKAGCVAKSKARVQGTPQGCEYQEGWFIDTSVSFYHTSEGQSFILSGRQSTRLPYQEQKPQPIILYTLGEKGAAGCLFIQQFFTRCLHHGLPPIPYTGSLPKVLLERTAYVSLANFFCADLTTLVFSTNWILSAFCLLESLQIFLFYWSHNFSFLLGRYECVLFMCLSIISVKFDEGKGSYVLQTSFWTTQKNQRV